MVGSLQAAGVEVIETGDGIQAFTTMCNFMSGIDLVITDMTMPDMTGIQLAGEIKKINPDIPIILCTGFSYQANDNKSNATNIQGYIKKPVLMKELAGTIRKVLSNSKHRYQKKA